MKFSPNSVYLLFKLFRASSFKRRYSQCAASGKPSARKGRLAGRVVLNSIELRIESLRKYLMNDNLYHAERRKVSQTEGGAEAYRAKSQKEEELFIYCSSCKTRSIGELTVATIIASYNKAFLASSLARAADEGGKELAVSSAGLALFFN